MNKILLLCFFIFTASVQAGGSNQGYAVNPQAAPVTIASNCSQTLANISIQASKLLDGSLGGFLITSNQTIDRSSLVFQVPNCTNITIFSSCIRFVRKTQLTCGNNNSASNYTNFNQSFNYYEFGLGRNCTSILILFSTGLFYNITRGEFRYDGSCTYCSIYAPVSCVPLNLSNNFTKVNITSPPPAINGIRSGDRTGSTGDPGRTGGISGGGGTTGIETQAEFQDQGKKDLPGQEGKEGKIQGKGKGEGGGLSTSLQEQVSEGTSSDPPEQRLPTQGKPMEWEGEMGREQEGQSILSQPLPQGTILSEEKHPIQLPLESGLPEQSTNIPREGESSSNSGSATELETQLSPSTGLFSPATTYSESEPIPGSLSRTESSDRPFSSAGGTGIHDSTEQSILKQKVKGGAATAFVVLLCFYIMVTVFLVFLTLYVLFNVASVEKNRIKDDLYRQTKYN
jgi:hypothetical protein